MASTAIFVVVLKFLLELFLAFFILRVQWNAINRAYFAALGGIEVADTLGAT